MEGIYRNKTESREHESVNERMTCDFLDITESQLGLIKERIRSVEGHVRISVHPLYLSRHPRTFYAEGPKVPQDEVEASLVDGFEKTVRSVAKSKSSSPLLVFEEEQFVHDTRQIVANLSLSNEASLTELGFLFLKTEPGAGSLHGLTAARTYEASNSVPASAQASFLQEEQVKLVTELRQYSAQPPLGDAPIIIANEDRIRRMRERRKVMGDLIQVEDILGERRGAVLDAIIPTLGIRSALIGGGYFYNHKNARPELSRLGGCAGGVTTALRERGVKVDISRFAWSPREYLQEQGIQTRQTGKKGDSEPGQDK